MGHQPPMWEGALVEVIGLCLLTLFAMRWCCSMLSENKWRIRNLKSQPCLELWVNRIDTCDLPKICVCIPHPTKKEYFDHWMCEQTGIKTDKAQAGAFECIWMHLSNKQNSLSANKQPLQGLFSFFHTLQHWGAMTISVSTNHTPITSLPQWCCYTTHISLCWSMAEKAKSVIVYKINIYQLKHCHLDRTSKAMGSISILLTYLLCYWLLSW